MPLLSLRGFAVSSIFVLAAGGLSQAQFDMPLNHPGADTTPQQVHELVSQYCRLDYEGARLDPKSWTKFQPLVSWKTNPDYAHIDVIARYTVEATPLVAHGKSTVKVQYQSLGQFETGVGYSRRAESSKEVEYTVTAENGEWRISDTEPNFPHVSRAAMLKWLNEQISTTQDPNARKLYQETLRQLQLQPASPASSVAK
jgi:hypothetical protein